jgi:LysM repeat protein
VRPGDNLASIAQEAGIPLEELQSLNPELDPQGLVSGQRVRLRESGG